MRNRLGEVLTTGEYCGTARRLKPPLAFRVFRGFFAAFFTVPQLRDGKSYRIRQSPSPPG